MDAQSQQVLVWYSISSDQKNNKILLIGLGAVGICALAALKSLKINNVVF